MVHGFRYFGGVTESVLTDRMKTVLLDQIGALFYTDFVLSVGDAIELTLVMPSEITLADNMRVRCRGKVVRVAKPVVGTRTGVAVHLEGYEFLPDAEPAIESARNFGRISALHEHKLEESEAAETPAPPRATLVP